MNYAIESEDLFFAYSAGKHVLSGINIQVKQGEVFGLLGPNGAGKTTFVKTLLDFVRPQRGRLLLLGLPPQQLNRVGIAYLPERQAIPRFLTAREFLIYQSRLAGLARNEIPVEIDRVLAAVKIEEHRNSRIETFSKGMLQRLGLAQALLGSPRLLLLDEPNSGLDPIGVMDIRSVLLAEKERGATIFINSHRLLEVEQLCDSFAILNQGKVIAGGSRDDLSSRRGIELELEETTPEILAHLRQLDAALRIKDRRIELTISDPELERLFPGQLVAMGARINYYARKKESLEEVFRRTVEEQS